MTFSQITQKIGRFLSKKLILILVINLIFVIIYITFCWIDNKYFNGTYRFDPTSLWKLLVLPILPSITSAIIYDQISKNEAEHLSSIKYTEVIQQISNANKTVKIQSTFSYLLDCYADNHWNDFKGALSSLLHKHQNKGVSVKILLLNPFSEIAVYRDKERRGQVLKSLYKNLSSLSKFLDNTNFTFVEVKVYDRLPGLQLHQIDSELHVSYFPPDKPASEQKRMKYKINTNTADFHLQWFDEVWNDEIRTISLNNYMRAHVRVYTNGEEIYASYLRYLLFPNKQIFLLLNTDNEYIELVSKLGGERNKPFNRLIKNIEIGDNQTFIINKKIYRGEFITTGASFQNACYYGTLKYGLKKGSEFKVLLLE